MLARDESGTLALLSTEVEESYPSLTPECPQAHWFEREIAEQWGILPTGHPWLKLIRFHKSYRTDGQVFAADSDSAGVTDYFQVSGAEIHEVAVGPVHAGIIEPGHFRFQCHGENVYHLEISLGYQHRGIEPPCVRGPVKAQDSPYRDRRRRYNRRPRHGILSRHGSAEQLQAACPGRVPARHRA